MKALKIILYIVLGLGALWMILGLFAKKDYPIERSQEINAPSEVVFEQIHLFKNFINWSPWHVYDPNMKTEISGADGEPGAKYTWTGNDKVGTGYQLIKAVAPGRVDFEINWGWGPFPAYFMLEEMPEGKTKLTWRMDMHVAFPWNAFSMLTDVNAFVGKDFENGLANIKKVCEQIAHPKYRGYEVAESVIPAKFYLAIRKTIDTAQVSAYYAEHLPRLMTMVINKKLTMSGAPSGLFWTWGKETDMAAAIPVAEKTKLDSAQTYPIGGRALTIEYFGPYSKTSDAHMALEEYMQEKKLQSVPPVLEEYVTDPTSEPDTMKWLTKVIYFVEPKSDTTLLEKK